MEHEVLERIASASSRAQQVKKESRTSIECHLYAFALWLVLLGMMPSFFLYYFVAAGFVPVWLRIVQYPQPDPLSLFFVSLWATVYALVAWWLARAMYRLGQHRRRWALPAVPILLVLVSLLPIYIPVSHGTESSMTIVRVVTELWRRM